MQVQSWSADNYRSRVQTTNLERHKPNTLHGVANHQEVLDRSQGGDIHPYVEERHADQAFVQVKRAHEDLAQHAV